MADVDRQAVTKRVYRKLAEPSFRKRLTAVLPDGTRPIIVALPSDRVLGLIIDVARSGGAANVAMPMLNGFLVFTIHIEPDSVGKTAPSGRLSPECTVGLFVERLRIDGGTAVYHFAVERSTGSRDTGSAELVAVGD
jgi:hypothetical protein